MCICQNRGRVNTNEARAGTSFSALLRNCRGCFGLALFCDVDEMQHRILLRIVRMAASAALPRWRWRPSSLLCLATRSCPN